MDVNYFMIISMYLEAVKCFDLQTGHFVVLLVMEGR